MATLADLSRKLKLGDRCNLLTTCSFLRQTAFLVAWVVKSGEGEPFLPLFFQGFEAFRVKILRLPPARFEPDSATVSTTTLYEKSATTVGAESGAEPANGQNLDMLAALVGILTQEQKAAFLALLTTPKPGV